MWIKNQSKADFILVNIDHQDSIQVARNSRTAEIGIHRFRACDASEHTKSIWIVNEPESPEREAKIRAVMDKIAYGIQHGSPIVDISEQ